MAKVTKKATKAAAKKVAPEVRIALDTLWSACRKAGLGPDTPEGKAYAKAVAALDEE